MTTLARYLATHRLTEAKFAVQIGMSRVSVSHWVNNHSIPHRASMTAIFNATEGAVRPEDFGRAGGLEIARASEGVGLAPDARLPQEHHCEHGKASERA